MTHPRVEKNSFSSTLPMKKAVHRTKVDAPKGHTHIAPDFRVAIDFGTTYTTIAFTKCRAKDKKRSAVFTIEEFPGDRCVGHNGTQVPTEIRYLSHKDGATRNTQKLGPNVLYGYEITRRLEIPEENPLRLAYKNSGLVTKPKLLLDENPLLSDLKKGLLDVIQVLKKDKLIKKNEEVIEHLLVCFLRHTKSVLERDHGLNKSSIVEMTLAVPVCWSARANAAMSTCLSRAMRTVRFGTDGFSMPQLFMVNEAEAAAMYTLWSDITSLKRYECFILVDCGGGTTDIGTYSVSNQMPLRLEEEVSHPRGAVCGSGDLNTRMRRFAAVNLADETYLEDKDEGITIYNIIDSEVMPHFESEVKRAYDPNQQESFTFRIHGLRKSLTNPRLMKNRFVLTSEDLQGLFDDSLKTIERLLLDQIEHTRRNGTRVDKVVLVGGFGDSPALKTYLKATLQRVNNEHGTNVELVLAAANTSATGVAIGAILRAEDKERGPKRVPCRSIGVLYHVSDDPGAFDKDVLAQKWSVSSLSGDLYIMKTIKWIIKAGMGEIKPVHTFDFTSIHHFSPDASRWIAKEVLYASDTCVEDYYTRGHTKNKGKTSKFGFVVFDVTHLRDHIDLTSPSVTDKGEDLYEVNLRIRMVVIDRHLEFTAYWPASDKNAVAIQGSQTCFDLSAAFRPGTA